MKEDQVDINPKTKKNGESLKTEEAFEPFITHLKAPTPTTMGQVSLPPKEQVFSGEM